MKEFNLTMTIDVKATAEDANSVKAVLGKIGRNMPREDNSIEAITLEPISVRISEKKPRKPEA